VAQLSTLGIIKSSMKILRFIPWILLILVVVIALASRRLAAQNATANPGIRAGLLYMQLSASLSESGQSNTLSQVRKMYSALQDERNDTAIADTVAILEQLHSGHTNYALGLLESRLDTALINRSLSPYDQEAKSIVEMARAYRTKFPHTVGYGDIDKNVQRAFDALHK
jgi:hypothetical protein